MKRTILILLTFLIGVTMAAEKKILVAYYSHAHVHLLREV